MKRFISISIGSKGRSRGMDGRRWPVDLRSEVWS
jgi:hypothetical protein